MFERKEVLALTGVRRSGKTSLMHIMIRGSLETVEPKQIMYVNLEDPTFEQASIDDIYRSYLELMLPDDGQFLFLNEVQEKVGWEKWGKKMY
ncbi:MAG: AAA family ATPase, partial [Thermoplasmatota archaeon]